MLRTMESKKIKDRLKKLLGGMYERHSTNKVKQVFLGFDDNSDGVLGPEEVIQLLKALPIPTEKHRELDDVIKQLRSNPGVLLR